MEKNRIDVYRVFEDIIRQITAGGKSTRQEATTDEKEGHMAPI
jgi:hypothetical protein